MLETLNFGFIQYSTRQPTNGLDKKYSTIKIIHHIHVKNQPYMFRHWSDISGILRTRNARCDWQNISSSCSSHIQFFLFRLTVDLSALWLAASSLRIVAVCVHFQRRTFIYCFLSPAETFYWPRKLINRGCEGFGLSVAF